MMIDFVALTQHCAPQVAPATMVAIVQTESSFNPYAIGVVGGRLLHQPVSVAEAVSTTHALDAGGWNYSAGLMQVNRANWRRYGIDANTAFEPCTNLAAGAAILSDCFARAGKLRPDVQGALQDSLSCYSSGDFTTGYRTGYVQRVVDNAAVRAVPSVPAVDPAVTPIPVVPLTRGVLSARDERSQVGYGVNYRAGVARARASPPSLPERPQEESADRSAVVF
jgi:type IV secretion system protein VirB1